MHPFWCYLLAANGTEWQEWQYTFSTSFLTAWTAWRFLSNNEINYKVGCIARWLQNMTPTTVSACIYVKVTPKKPKEDGFLWKWVIQYANYPPRYGLEGSSWEHQETNLLKATWLPIIPKTEAQGRYLEHGLQLLLFFRRVEVYPLTNPPSPAAQRNQGQHQCKSFWLLF